MQIKSHNIDELAEGDALLLEALNKMSTKMAVQHVFQSTGLSKRLLYNRALELKKTDK